MQWFYKKFSMNGTCFTLEVQHPDPKMTPEDWLRKLLNQVINSFKNSSSVVVRPGDRIGMSLRNNIYDKEPLYISLRRGDQLSVDVVFDHIMKIYDSNKEFFLNGHLEIRFDHLQISHGSGSIIRNFGQRCMW